MRALHVRSRSAGPLLTATPLRLILVTALTNLAFWLLWPAAIVRVAGLGWGGGATGLFGSAAPLALFAALPLAPKLVRTLGPKHVVRLAVVALVVGALGSAFLTGGMLEWLWTALIGFGTGLRWIAVDSWIADIVPADRSGRVLSLGETIVGIGFAAGPAAASALGAGSTMPGVVAAALSLAGGILVRHADEPEPAAAALTQVRPMGRLAGLASGATLLLLASAFLGGLNETGFAGIAPLLSIASGGDRPLLAAAAVGLGSFVAQYALGAAADRWGGCKVLMVCAALLSASLATLAFASSLLPLASFIIGGVGGGLYTVAIVFGLQARRGTTPSAPLIGAAALAYTGGTLIAPAAAGVSIDLAGPTLPLVVLSALAALLFVVIIGLRGWRWVDRSRTEGTTCAFRFSPAASSAQELSR